MSHKKQSEIVEQHLGNPDFLVPHGVFPRPDKSKAPPITLPSERFEVDRFQAGGTSFFVDSLVRLELGRGVKSDARSFFYGHIKRIYRSVANDERDATNILVQRFTWRRA